MYAYSYIGNGCFQYNVAARSAVEPTVVLLRPSLKEGPELLLDCIFQCRDMLDFGGLL